MDVDKSGDAASVGTSQVPSGSIGNEALFIEI